MSYLTAEQVRDWAAHQPEDGYWCEDCLSRLVQNPESGKYYCPNEMCLNQEEYDIKEEE